MGEREEGGKEGQGDREEIDTSNTEESEHRAADVRQVPAGRCGQKGTHKEGQHIWLLTLRRTNKCSQEKTLLTVRLQ